MGCLLVCDKPGCDKTAQMIVTNNRPAAPKPWWIQPTRDGTLLVACCDDCLVQLSKKKAA